MRRCLIAGLVLIGACDGGQPEVEPERSASESIESGNLGDGAVAPGEDSQDEALVPSPDDGTVIITPNFGEAPEGILENRADSARVWVGVYCETDPPEREFSFWANGRELERVEMSCGPIIRENAPHGQFSFVVPTGVLVLRIQDDTADVHSELEVGVTADRFITVTHRQVGADSGFLTSFDETGQRPTFAILE